MIRFKTKSRAVTHVLSRPLLKAKLSEQTEVNCKIILTFSNCVFFRQSYTSDWREQTEVAFFIPFFIKIRVRFDKKYKL